MPFLLFIAAVFLAFKLGLFNHIDYATTPYDRLTCQHVADRADGEPVSTLGGDKYVVQRVTNVRRVRKTQDLITCEATLTLDDGSRRDVTLTGWKGRNDVRISSF